MQTEQAVFLLGFMGSGKTYWGKRLAERLERPFLDLDSMVEEKAGKSIASIFSNLGESGFRNLEREVLHAVLQYPAAIVATGGGTPCFFDNLDWINAHGKSIYLKTPASVLAERLKQETGIRPLLSGIQATDLQIFIAEKVMEREPFYLQAQYILEQEDNETAFLKKLTSIAANY